MSMCFLIELISSFKTLIYSLMLYLITKFLIVLVCTVAQFLPNALKRNPMAFIPARFSVFSSSGILPKFPIAFSIIGNAQHANKIYIIAAVASHESSPPNININRLIYGSFSV
jgi:hypothetical protein